MLEIIAGLLIYLTHLLCFPFTEGMKMRSTKQEPNGNSKVNKAVSNYVQVLMIFFCFNDF